MSCIAFVNSPGLAAMSEEREILDLLSAVDDAELSDLLDNRVSVSDFFDPDIDALLESNGGSHDNDDDDDDIDSDSMLAFIPSLIAGDDGDIAEFTSALATSALTSTSVSPSSSTPTLAVEPTELEQVPDTTKSNSTRVERASKKKSTFQRQKEELLTLRASVVALEAELRAVKDYKARQPGTAGQVPPPSEYGLLWQGLATRQQKDRSRAEKENADLRKLLREQTNLARSLERAMRKRLNLMRTEAKHE